MLSLLNRKNINMMRRRIEDDNSSEEVNKRTKSRKTENETENDNEDDNEDDDDDDEDDDDEDDDDEDEDENENENENEIVQTIGESTLTKELMRISRKLGERDHSYEMIKKDLIEVIYSVIQCFPNIIYEY